MNKLRVMAAAMVVLLMSAGATAFAQGKLGVGTRKPSVDGVIRPANMAIRRTSTSR